MSSRRILERKGLPRKRIMTSAEALSWVLNIALNSAHVWRRCARLRKDERAHFYWPSAKTSYFRRHWVEYSEGPLIYWLKTPQRYMGWDKKWSYCNFNYHLKNQPLFLLIFSTVFLFSLSLLSPLTCIISFLLLALGLIYSSFSYSLKCKMRSLTWDAFFFSS